ncbi:olfactory receptor-like protein OLF1 [Rhinophrynus dorsalis]
MTPTSVVNAYTRLCDKRKKEEGAQLPGRMEQEEAIRHYLLVSVMEHSNQTTVSTFILLGLSNIPYLQVVYFMLFLGIYVITISGNILLIVVVRIDNQLRTPMYFFLSNLSFIDICFSSTIVPKILVNTLAHDKSISFMGCAAQMYFSLALGATECIILAVMAYDRYVAICNPLRYLTIMNKTFCLYLAAGSWIVSFLNSVIHACFTFQLPYCKSNQVNHFFCEMPPLFRISCRDTLFNEIAVYISGGIIALCSFILTLISYFLIISTILKIRSNKGRYKAFSTCASHLTVVCLYYGTIMFMYLRPRSSYSPDRDRAVSILYTVVTPMLNPIIYSIRNKNVKGTLRKTIAMKI